MLSRSLYQKAERQLIFAMRVATWPLGPDWPPADQKAARQKPPPPLG